MSGEQQMNGICGLVQMRLIMLDMRQESFLNSIRMGTALTMKKRRYRTDEKVKNLYTLDNDVAKSLRHIDQETILTTYHHGNLEIRHSKFRWKTHGKSNFDKFQSKVLHFR